jgi:hypothetical protein
MKKVILIGLALTVAACSKDDGRPSTGGSKNPPPIDQTAPSPTPAPEADAAAAKGDAAEITATAAASSSETTVASPVADSENLAVTTIKTMEVAVQILALQTDNLTTLRQIEEATDRATACASIRDYRGTRSSLEESVRLSEVAIGRCNTVLGPVNVASLTPEAKTVFADAEEACQRFRGTRAKLMGVLNQLTARGY